MARKAGKMTKHSKRHCTQWRTQKPHRCSNYVAGPCPTPGGCKLRK